MYMLKFYKEYYDHISQVRYILFQKIAIIILYILFCAEKIY